ncbi:MAG: hypothetical protein OXM61_14315 [Candidatus Poribacteria bacterium]|nr:hypothetical protein [Candidatus Poribacteria bacterium]
MKALFLTLCSVLLFIACGSDEIHEPTETKPNYFPDAVGSRWVYQNADGSKWTREITDGNDSQEKDYQTYTNTPPVSEAEIDFLKPTSFRVARNQFFFGITEKIDRYIQTKLLTSVKDEFQGLDLNVTLEPIPLSELIFFEIPLTANSQWDALNIKVNGNIMLQNLTLLQFPFEVHFNIKGEVISQDTIETPAGRFENTFEVKYSTKIVQTVLSNEESTVNNQTIWFVPHVGIVRMEDERGVTELIEYVLK